MDSTDLIDDSTSPDSLVSAEPGPQHGGFRPGSGRKPYIPTEADRQAVANMASAGLTQERIAEWLGKVSVRNLQKYFAPELECGQTDLIRRAAGAVSRAVDREEAWAVAMVLKARAGWKEASAVELTGTVTLDASALEAGRQRAYAMAKQIEGKK